MSFKRIEKLLEVILLKICHHPDHRRSRPVVWNLSTNKTFRLFIRKKKLSKGIKGEQIRESLFTF